MNTTRKKRHPKTDWAKTWTVPRNKPIQCPAGWEWVGSRIVGRVGPYLPAFEVAAALWPEDVAAALEAVCVVGGARWSAKFSRDTGAAPTPPMLVECSPRVPLTLDLPRGATIALRAATSRIGEVTCWPMKRLPPSPKEATRRATIAAQLDAEWAAKEEAR